MTPAELEVRMSELRETVPPEMWDLLPKPQLAICKPCGAEFMKYHFTICPDCLWLMARREFPAKLTGEPL